MDLFRKLDYNLILQVELTINNHIIRNVEAVEYNSYKNTPAKLVVTFANYTSNIDIKVGDEIVYKRGYENGTMEKRFIGFVSEITKNQAICYDELYFIRNQRCKVLEWVDPNGVKNISDKTILENMLSDIKDLSISNGKLRLKYNKEETNYSHINGNINKGAIINALFRQHIFYIDEIENAFVVEKPYSRIREDIDITNKVMIEDNTSKPLPKTIKIRFIIQSADSKQEDIIREIPEMVVSDEVYEMFFNDIDISEAVKLAKDKYEELNNLKMIGSFTLTGLPLIRMGEKIRVNGEYAKVVGVDETIDRKAIRQIVSLE